ncbi:MAG TPA: hypothetical protein VK177_20090 [Flavobacteriales bacterium]|nr:hypothetical protein [Flavobacteriales bacterium]
MKTDLWNRIRDFDLDYPLSEYGFSTRLAHENKWTKNFTKKAILEYKKFMYLAATSERMVSPSHIVDLVWHQHLIFTQSYKSFCEVLGKQIQHIPSTHDKNEVSVFKSAMDNTKKMYTEAFGEQPKEIWEYDDMYASLEIPEARFKFNKFLLSASTITLLLALPLYFLLAPVYVQIPNPGFIVLMFMLVLTAFIVLEIINVNYMQKVSIDLKAKPVIRELHPMEVLYFKTQTISKVIHGYSSHLISRGKIHVTSFKNVMLPANQQASCSEEHVVMEAFEPSENKPYTNLVNKLKSKTVFQNIVQSIDKIREHIVNSKQFANLFYLNFIVLAALVLLTITRLETGIANHKALVYISIMSIGLITASIIYLWKLRERYMAIIPRSFNKNHVNTQLNSLDWEWQYYVLGSAFFVPAFLPLVNLVEQREHPNTFFGGCGSSGCGTSSCGSGCGSSCGGGCGGCGGGCGS